MNPIRTLDIEIYDPDTDDWAQGRYLVHGHDDVLWTDDLDAALSFLRDSALAITALSYMK
jgi:hypothetical protein